MELFVCTKCLIEKDVSHYFIYKNKSNTRYKHCKDCNRIKSKIFKNKDKEGYNKKRKEKRKKYSIQEKEYRKQYYLEKIKPKNKLNKPKKKILTQEERLIYQKNYRNKHRESLKLDARRYRQENKNIISANKKKIYAKRTELDKIKQNIRVRIRKAIQNGYKSASSQELLGDTIYNVKIFLESKFTKGMNWENYGKDGWHIDHIKPCDAFDLSDPEQQKACFHYTNLQPLWSTRDIAMSYGEGSDYIGNLEKGYKIL